ncbi:MAG: S8 family serine peptidase [Pyrinomonadaceae bacterium]
MFARSSRKVSARLRLFFSLVFVITLAVVFLSVPTRSRATLQTAATDSSQKRTRPAFVPGEALVRYRSENLAKRVASLQTLSVDGRYLRVEIESFAGAEIVAGLRMAHMEPLDTLAVIEALNKDANVLYAEPNYLLFKDLTPNDPRFTSGELYAHTKIGAPQAWDTTTGSSSIVVGVIDEGIDKNHQDLAANMWVNPVEVANGVDDDGNGFVDDINGYNFAGNTGTIPADSHATHVAGTIGAVGDNNIGVVGVNWNVRLMSLKFISGTSGSTSNAIRACSYAKQMRDLWVSSGGTQGANVRVLNNSYGGGGSNQSFLDAINAANQSGILFVASAGNAPDDSERNNDLIPHFPASYIAPNVIAVASTDSLDNLSGFSHYGLNSVHMGAPGSGILSTTPNNTYSSFSGTSMATPQVAGAAALLLAANPNLASQQLRSLLLFNGNLIGALAGNTFTGRRLSVANSVAALAEGDTTPPGTVTNFHVNSQNGRSLNIGWTASGDDGAVGQASLYRVSFTDGTSGAVTPLKNVVPTASGTTQAIDVKIPYRHLTGTVTLREFDNVGNEGTPATLPVTIGQLEGDPYVPQLGSAAALSSGGTPLNLIGDDKLYSSAHSGGGFALPFSFPFFGQNYSSVDISTNGSLYFSTPPKRGNGDADDVPSSVVSLTEFKMIAGLWDDLRTDGRASDNVYVVTPDATRIIFRWQGEIYGDGTSPANQPQVNFEIELRSDGTVVTRYGSGQAAPINTSLFPVVGISAGEPQAYVIPTHTSETTPISLTNAQTVTFTPRALLVNSSVEFSQSQFGTGEAAPAVATISITRTGDTSSQASVDYTTVDGSATQKNDYMFAAGTMTFAPDQTSKLLSLPIVDDVYQEVPESFSVSLSNPIGMTLGSRTVTSVTITDNDAAPPTFNPLDNADQRFFIRQHYIDFLNRDPDSDGLNFWTNKIISCSGNLPCGPDERANEKVNASAAFFLSIEFQETGYLVYRTYKTAFGDPLGSAIINNVPTTISVPRVRFAEFIPDTQQIGEGVQVGVGNWAQQLELNKQAYMLAFVQRSRFTTAYATSLTPTNFVTQLFQKAGVSPSAQEQQDAINEFGVGASNTSDVAARARALRRVAENSTLKTNEYNRAFVLMQYFGYLRRNPNDTPDNDHSGWKFWLDKLDAANGNFVNSQMVLAFISSIEYRQRFAP